MKISPCYTHYHKMIKKCAYTIICDFKLPDIFPHALNSKNIFHVLFFIFPPQMSTTTPKVVMFNMEIGDAPPEESADGAVDHNQLEEQVKELGQAIAGKYII